MSSLVSRPEGPRSANTWRRQRPPARTPPLTAAGRGGRARPPSPQRLRLSPSRSRRGRVPVLAAAEHEAFRGTLCRSPRRPAESSRRGSGQHPASPSRLGGGGSDVRLSHQTLFWSVLYLYPGSRAAVSFLGPNSSPFRTTGKFPDGGLRRGANRTGCLLVSARVTGTDSTGSAGAGAASCLPRGREEGGMGGRR